MLNSKLEKLNDNLFSILVPGEGPAKTLQGEILRAYNRIAYRWYNDGDFVHTGHGIETAGAAWCFINSNIRNDRNISMQLSKVANEYNDHKYEMAIDDLGEAILNYVSTSIANGELTKISEDFYAYESDAIDRFGDPNDDFDDNDDEDDNW